MARYTPPGMTAQQAAKLRRGTKEIERKYARQQVASMTKPRKGKSFFGFMENLGETVPQLIGGSAELGKQVGLAAYHDIKAGRGITKPGGLLVGKSEGGDLIKAQVAAIPGQIKLLADPNEWYEHPGFQILNTAGLVLPAARAASIGRLATTIRAANPGMSVLRANKAAVAESFHPGFAASKGIKGGIAPRRIEGKYGAAPGRMPSRQPIVRGGQKAIDQLSEAIDVRNPERIFSASRRAQAAARRNAIRETRRTRAARQRMEEIITQAITPSKRGRAARAFGLSTKVDPAVGAALVAALEGPAGRSVREATEIRIKQLNSVLEQNQDLRPMRDQIDQLHAERQALTEAGEDTGAVDAQITRQQDALDFLLGKNVAPVTGSPIRDLVHKTMTQTLGKERANQSIKLWDARARAASPDDPAAWYTANVAGTRQMPLEQFAPEGAALYQRMAADQGGWYFPIQRALDDMGDKTMQVGQLYAALKKRGISTEELRNSGMEEVAQRAPDTVITPSQVLGELHAGGYFRTFDPDVQITKQDPSADPYRGYTTRYDPDVMPQINSRDAAPGEYHEMVVRYPELPGTRAGEQHWGKSGNAYHVRYQIFPDEDGNRVMLIDEIQSDWASDYRRAGKEGAQERSPGETAAEGVAHEERVTAAGEDLALSQQRVREIGAEIQQAADDGVDWETIPGLRQRLSDAVSGVDKASDRLTLAERERRDFHRFVSSRIPPSPMGQKRYLDNAIRQVLREADNQDVDHIVLVDGDTQALRNSATELGPDEGVTVDEGFDNGRYGEWVDDTTGEPLTNEEITAKLREQGRGGSFTRLYNKEIPEVLAKIGGEETRYLDDAYTGRHSAVPNQYDYTDYDGYMQTEDSAMPGTVFEMTPEVKAKIRKEQPLYRRNFEGLPQGATEFLADGRARVTMFEKADVSTWVHELAHVALRDLDPDDLRTLEHEIAGGRKLDEWTEADHEEYARSFETYLRDGYAAPALRDVFAKIAAWMKDVWRRTGGEAEQLNPEVADVFDRMLGRRYQNTVVLDDAEIAQVRADIADLQKALDSGDVDRIADASNALASLSEQAEAAGVELLMRNAKSPEHEEAILAGLAERKNAIVEDYRRRGLIGYGEEARGYFPQFSQWEALGQPNVAPSRIAATGATVGTPRVTSKALNRNRNKLVRMQTGEVLNDPTSVIYILRARLRLHETIKARNELWAVGEPIRAGEPIGVRGQVALVRNPDVAPERMRTATEAAASLTREDYTRLQKRRAIEDVDEVDTSPVREQMIWTPDDGPRPEWTRDEANVRAVPLKIATKRLGDVFNSGPRNQATAALGIANALARAALIYTPLGGVRYVFRNWIQNAVLMALTQPSAFLKLASNRKLRSEHPELWDRINEEFGTIQAQALPEFNTRAQGRMQRAERRSNQISGQIGEHLGRFADVPLRSASWRRHAERYGFTSPADYERLLDDPDLAEIRNTISQRVREDMIDFDALSPYEKEVLTRYLFIWPFVRGATKWPFMYAREYPMRLAAASLMTPRTDDGRSLKEVLKAGDFDLSWLNPVDPLVQNLQRVEATGRRVSHGDYNLSPLAGVLSPQLQMLLDAGSGNLGKDVPHQLATEFVPFYSTVEAALGGKQATKDFALRTVGKQTRPRSVVKKANEWMGELDSVLKTADEKGFTIPPAAKARVERMRAAYGDWTEESARAKWAKQDVGVDETDDAERTQLLLGVMREHYPDEYAALQRDSEQSTGMTAEDAVASDRFDNAKIYRAVYDQMFGLRQQILDDAKEAGWR